MELSMEIIKELMDKMVATGLGELEIETDDGGLVLRAKQEAPKFTAAPTFMGGAMQQAAPVVSPEATVTAAAQPVLEGNVITSPIVGTFYAAPAPDKAPFVQVGDKVKTGDVVFIIESMKLMNEVNSDFSGTVAEILVENGQAVEYGQPIMRIV